MTRALHFCRWCGRRPAPSTDPYGRGRPPTFCCDGHRTVYRRIFSATNWQGAVSFTTACAHGCDDTQLVIPGPVHAPGAWAHLEAQVGEIVHGHAVTVTVAPAAAGTSAMWADEFLRGRA